MSLSSNIDTVCNDVYKCLSFNGIKLEKDYVFIENLFGELFVKALTDENPSRQFSMKIGDDFIKCDDNHNIKFNILPFKDDIEVPELSDEELEKKRESYYEYLLEIGEVTEEEMQKSLAE